MIKNVPCALLVKWPQEWKAKKSFHVYWVSDWLNGPASVQSSLQEQLGGSVKGFPLEQLATYLDALVEARVPEGFNFTK